MILTVTLNAAIDKRYVMRTFLEGEVNRVISCVCTPGGKGLNVSKPAVIAGAEVVVTGFVGGKAGEYITEEIEKLGIKSEFYHLKGESRSCINIWDETKQKQTELLEPGFSVKPEEFEGFLRKFKELVKRADVVAISGSIPKGLTFMAYPTLVSIVKDAGKRVILDTSGELLAEGIKAKPTMVKPNIDEIRMLTNSKCDTEEELLEAAVGIHRTGVDIVVVSLGAEGSAMVTKEGIFRAKVPKQNAVNTVGCGDSMIAGFALGMETGDKGMEEVLRQASAISAAAALCEETGSFVMADMHRVYPQIVIEKIENEVGKWL